MATLQKIRNRAGLLIIVIGVALLAFIVGDGLRSGGTLFQMSNNYALKIDGEKIKAEDYHQRLQQLQRLPKLMAIILQMSSACNSIISLPKSTSKALL